MDSTFQTIVAVGIVAVAGGYLAYKSYLAFFKRRGAGCTSCHHCPTETNASKPFVDVESLTGGKASPGHGKSR